MATTVNNTMVKIQTVTVGSGGASSITFSSIPQTYTDLYVLLSTRSNRNGVNDQIYMTPNGATSGGSRRVLLGDGSSAASYNGSDFETAYNQGNNTTANVFDNISIYIPNYTSSNYKSWSTDAVTENNATSAIASMRANLWSSTSAITSLVFDCGAYGPFLQYSKATLYGITATPNTTKASGGIIYQDATYMYHVFPYTSTFTPSTALSCDVMVVAGGGGGGVNNGGGGGAGGLLGFISQSLTATGYTVTVGGGGAGGTSSRGTTGSDSQFGSLTLVKGGGGAGGYDVPSGNKAGLSGGSGGGGGNAGAGGAASPSGQGNAGGSSSFGGATSPAGGGGGAGAVGQDTPDSNTAGAGGAGSSTYSSWAIATGTGQIVSGTGYYAGGGGGSIIGGTTAGAGGNGGGGAGGKSAAGSSATVNTGGGGGGSTSAGNGGNGGSGIVIVRYAK